MASKAYFILALLLLSTFMSSFSFARELQASKSSLAADGEGGPFDPNRPVLPGRPGKPYTRPCKRAYGCRPDPDRPVIPGRPGKPYTRPCKRAYGCRPPAPQRKG